MERISFISVLEKYLLYSEMMSQYAKLNAEDQKIIEPYVDRLKKGWQQDLSNIRVRLTGSINPRPA